MAAIVFAYVVVDDAGDDVQSFGSLGDASAHLVANTGKGWTVETRQT